MKIYLGMNPLIIRLWISLVCSQYFYSSINYHQGVLELSSESAVGCYNSPFVSPNLLVDLSVYCKHGLCARVCEREKEREREIF